MTAATRKPDPRSSRSETIASIAESWAKMMEVNATSHPERLAPDAPRFTDYGWRHFDSKVAVEMLLAEQPTYRALKPILFSGLCTWVVCPRRNSLRQHGMLLVGIEQMRAAEAIGRAAFSGQNIPDHDLLGDMLGRMLSLGADFYSDFYYPIGGLAQVLRSTTPGNFRQSLEKHSQNSLTIVATMEIYDFHARHLSDINKYYQSSETKGYEVYRLVHKARNERAKIGTDYFEECWSNVRATAAMIYAASTIKLNDDVSLLELIRDGKANFGDHGDLLRPWVARARYAAESVLGKLVHPGIGRVNAAHLPDIAPEQPPEPRFSNAEQHAITAEFDRSALLGNRQDGVKRIRTSRR